MKNGSGSHGKENSAVTQNTTFLSQKTWRTIGAISVLLAGLMAWLGADMDFKGHSLFFLLSYWGFFLVLLLVAFYMVLLDIRYIRLNYLQDEREIFLDTLGNEELRQVLRDQEKTGDPMADDHTPGSE